MSGLWDTLTRKLWDWYKTHDGDANAHHTKYTDGDVIDAIATYGDIGIGTDTPYCDLDIGGLFNPSLGSSHAPNLAISSNENKLTGLHFRNINTSGSSVDSRLIISDPAGHYMAFSMPGLGVTGSLFGVQRLSACYLFNSGGTPRHMIIGTLSGKDLMFGTSGSIRLKILANGNIGIANTSPTAKLDINSDKIRVRIGKTPSSATDTGNQGDICWDAGYVYVCTATNTWKRASLSTW